MTRTIRAALIAASLLLAFVLGRTTAETPEPLPAPTSFTPFPTYAPSPTAIAGLHDYAVPASPSGSAATPAPSPEASRSSRQRRSVAQRDVRQARHHTNRNIRGTARWHATGRDGHYAAASCALRKAIGPHWRGSYVLVAYGRRAIEVRLNDVIGRLPSGRCSATLIDLSDEAFRYLAPLSRGVLRVTVGY